MSVEENNILAAKADFFMSSPQTKLKAERRHAGIVEYVLKMFLVLNMGRNKARRAFRRDCQDVRAEDVDQLSVGIALLLCKMTRSVQRCSAYRHPKGG